MWEALLSVQVYFREVALTVVWSLGGLRAGPLSPVGQDAGDGGFFPGLMLSWGLTGRTEYAWQKA